MFPGSCVTCCVKWAHWTQNLSMTIVMQTMQYSTVQYSTVMQTMRYCGANWYLEISDGDCQVQFMVTVQHNTLTTYNKHCHRQAEQGVSAVDLDSDNCHYHRWCQRGGCGSPRANGLFFNIIIQDQRSGKHWSIFCIVDLAHHQPWLLVGARPEVPGQGSSIRSIGTMFCAPPN